MQTNFLRSHWAALAIMGLATHLRTAAQEIVQWGGVGTVPMPTVVNPLQISQGTFHSAALQADGTVALWGTPINGSLTPPANLTNIVQVECSGYATFALTGTGTVRAWGDNYWTQTNIPTFLNNVITIAAGVNNGFAMTVDGTLYAWGNNSHGLLSIPANVQKQTQKLAIGSLHALALGQNGLVTAWGDNTYGQTAVPSGLGVCKDIAAGLHHCLAVKANGTVVGWGWNPANQTTVPAGLNDVIAVSAGYYHSAALKADGSVVCWGANDAGQGTSPVAAGSTLQLKSGGNTNLALRSPGGAAPRITSLRRAFATTNATQFRYQGLAYNTPSSWSATGVPNGLTFDTTTGTLTGTPAAAGSADIQLTATNAHGSDTITLKLYSVNPTTSPTLAEALDIPTATVWAETGWQGSTGNDRNGNAPNDGVDHVVPSNLPVTCSPTDPQFSPLPYYCQGSSRVTALIPGPTRLRWWRGPSDPAFGVANQSNVYVGGLASSGQTDYFSANWQQSERDLGPGLHEVSWNSFFSSTVWISATEIPYGSALDQVSTAPLPTTTLADALDLPGATWTTSATDSWKGYAAAHAADGVDYVCMTQPATPGASAFIQNTFTGPSQITWKWRGERNAGTMRLYVDDVLAKTGGDDHLNYWVQERITIPAGSHVLRWECTSSHTGLPVVAALDAISVAPSVTMDEAVGSPGLTWTTGGTSPWIALNESGISGHPSVAQVTIASGQTGYLETTVTGPGHFQFWVGTNYLTISLDEIVLSQGDSQSGQMLISVPTGSHTIRFEKSTGQTSTIDDVTFTQREATLSVGLGQPASPVLQYSPAPIANYSENGYMGGGGSIFFPLPTSSRALTVSLEYQGLLSFTPAHFSTPASANVPTVFSSVIPLGTAKLTLSGQPILRNLQLTEGAVVSVPEAWDSSHAVYTVSDAAKVHAMAVPTSIATDGDAIYIPIGEWLESSVQGPATVSFTYWNYLIATLTVEGVSTPNYLYGNSFGASTRTLHIPQNAVATLRWQPQSDNPITLDALQVTYPLEIPLAEAIESTTMLPSGVPGWIGESLPALGDGMGDFAYSPALAAGEETWLEGSMTGPFEFSYRLDEPNARVRLFINGELQGDSDLAPTARGLRAELVDGRAYQVKISVTGGKIRLGGFSTALDTNLGSIGGRYRNKEIVFWGNNVSNYFSMGVSPTGSEGEFGLFATGSGTLSFSDYPFVYTTKNYLPAAEATNTVSLTGTPTTLANRTINLPGGLICAKFVITKQFRTYPAPAWPSEYSYDYSEAVMLISDILISRGKPSLTSWTDSHLLGNFDNAPTADPDDDGLTNATEFLLGTSPATPNTSPLLVSRDLSGRLSLRLPGISHSTTGYSIVLQTSTDLVNWADAPASAYLGSQGNIRRWQAPASPTPCQFTRFKLVEVP